MRRLRICGLYKNGKPAGPSCNLEFWTTELPVGIGFDVAIVVTSHGFDAKAARRKLKHQ